MKVKAVLKQDIQRRIFWFSGNYLIMFAILGLVPPFLNYFFGDMFDVNDYISAMNFINSLLLPILVVSFVVDDQGSRISDYYFKTRQGRHLYLFSLLICGLCLGLLAGFLLIGVCALLSMVLSVAVSWKVLTVLLASYILLPLFYLVLGITMYLFFHIQGVTLTIFNLVFVMIVPILINIGASTIGWVVLLQSPFYILTFLGMGLGTMDELFYCLVSILVLYGINHWKILRIDF